MKAKIVFFCILTAFCLAAKFHPAVAEEATESEQHTIQKNGKTYFKDGEYWYDNDGHIMEVSSDSLADFSSDEPESSTTASESYPSSENEIATVEEASSAMQETVASSIDEASSKNTFSTTETADENAYDTVESTTAPIEIVSSNTNTATTEERTSQTEVTPPLKKTGTVLPHTGVKKNPQSIFWGIACLTIGLVILKRQA